jgi:hypothetical protein
MKTIRLYFNAAREALRLARFGWTNELRRQRFNLPF